MYLRLLDRQPLAHYKKYLLRTCRIITDAMEQGLVQDSKEAKCTDEEKDEAGKQDVLSPGANGRKR
jgi:hypothetical protein